MKLKGMQGTASSSRKQTEGSVGNKETGGLMDGVPEQGTPGQDALLPSDFQCFHLEMQVRAVDSGRVNSLQPKFPCRCQTQDCVTSHLPEARPRGSKKRKEGKVEGGGGEYGCLGETPHETVPSTEVRCRKEVTEGRHGSPRGNKRLCEV